MGIQTKIEWADHTWNPWRGCTKVSAGCTNCYAEKQAKRNPAVLGEWGPNGTRAVAAEQYWHLPAAWNRKAEANESWHAANATTDPPRPRVFCGSLMDIFEDRPDLQPWRERVFETIDATPNLDWLLVTKRPENIQRMWCSHINTDGKPPSQLYRENVWLLTSVENQEMADQRIPQLLKCRALSPVLGLSCEPLLGPLDLSQWLNCEHSRRYEDVVCPACGRVNNGNRLDWAIAGGESGPNARPCEVAWIRSIVAQCKAASVPCFVKQLGARIGVANDSTSEWPFGGDEWIDLEPQRTRTHQGDTKYIRIGHKKGGVDWEWPEDLRVRELPTVAKATM